MKRFFLCGTITVVVAICFGMNPVSAKKSPDVTNCGIEPSLIDERHYTSGRSKQLQPSQTLQISVAERIVNLDDKPERDLMEKRALLEEESHSPDARWSWTSLASREAWAKQPDKAIEHVRHILQNFPDGYEVLRHHERIIVTPLIMQGRKADLERLLMESVSRAKEVCGPHSAEAQKQLGVLVQFYVEQKMKNQALTSLDEFLNLGIPKGPTRSEMLWRSHCNCFGFCNVEEVLSRIRHSAVVDAEKGDTSFSLNMLEKIFLAQQKSLKADDEMFSETYECLGDVYKYGHRYFESEHYYSEALRIARKYVEDRFAMSSDMKENYIQVLRQIGNTSELERVKKLGLAPSKDSEFGAGKP